MADQVALRNVYELCRQRGSSHTWCEDEAASWLRRMKQAQQVKQ